MFQTDFTTLPKVELHLHLDCSLSYEVVHLINPYITREQYQRDFIAPAKCPTLADYITRAVKGVELMQTREQLRLVTLDLLQQLQCDRVLYAEIRFAPLLHTQQGLTPTEVVDCVNAALMEGISVTGVQARLILCTLRHFSEAQSLETAQLVEQFQKTNVVGFDIAADEAGYPIDQHRQAFAYAHQKGLHITAHAGEAKGACSVWETLEHFHPRRIGHGVRSVEDPQLMAFLKKENIHLEICPTSNVQTNVVDQLEHHPVDNIYQSGVSMSINTDARTISNTTLNAEYQQLERLFGWGKSHFLHCNAEAIRHAFIPEDQKVALLKQLFKAYE